MTSSSPSLLLPVNTVGRKSEFSLSPETEDEDEVTTGNSSTDDRERRLDRRFVDRRDTGTDWTKPTATKKAADNWWDER